MGAAHGDSPPGVLPVMLACLILAACSHETKRENPLDPQLASAPSLAASANDTTGFVTLSWGSYEGEAPFGAWRVLRQVEGTVQVDTLAWIDEEGVRQHVDTTPTLGVDYVYRLSAVNAAGLALESEPVTVPAGRLPGLRMVQVQMNSTDATAAIEWAPYVGPKFSTYQLWRELAGDQRLLAEIADSASTTYVDTAIAGGTTHQYWVVAHTSDGVATGTDTLSGSLHDAVDSWQLSLRPDQDFARLYFIDGAIHALIASPDRVRLVRYTADGEAASEEILFEFEGLFQTLDNVYPDNLPAPFEPQINPRGSMMSVSGDGVRHLSVASGDAAFLLSLDTESQVKSARATPFAGMPLQLSVEPDEVEQVRLWSTAGAIDRYQLFDNLMVGGESANFVDDFSASSAWRPDNIRAGFLRFTVQGVLGYATGFDRRDGYAAAITGSGWQGARVEIDVSSNGRGTPGVSIGPAYLPDEANGIWLRSRSEGSRFLRLSMDEPEDHLHLHSFADGDVVDSLVVPWVTMPNLTYRLGLELDVDAISIETPYAWAGPRDRNESWAGVLATDRDAGLFTEGSAMTVKFDGEPVRGVEGLPVFSDARRFAGDGADSVIATMPDERIVTIQRLRRSSVSGIQWPKPGAGITLGGVGGDPGDLTMPISAAASPDGRYYVLDAGTAQVKSYATDGTFITSFGSRGNTPGQFELGDGFQSESFTGSIIIDDEGFIYVADMANLRIQKFGP